MYENNSIDSLTASQVNGQQVTMSGYRTGVVQVTDFNSLKSDADSANEGSAALGPWIAGHPFADGVYWNVLSGANLQGSTNTSIGPSNIAISSVNPPIPTGVGMAGTLPPGAAITAKVKGFFTGRVANFLPVWVIVVVVVGIGIVLITVVKKGGSRLRGRGGY